MDGLGNAYLNETLWDQTAPTSTNTQQAKEGTAVGNMFRDIIGTVPDIFSAFAQSRVTSPNQQPGYYPGYMPAHPPRRSNTGMIIGVVAGVALIGTVIYVTTRKPKKK